MRLWHPNKQVSLPSPSSILHGEENKKAGESIFNFLKVMKTSAYNNNSVFHYYFCKKNNQKFFKSNFKLSILLFSIYAKIK